MPFLNAFSGKKILLLGFIFVLLVAIPLTVYILQKQQELRSRAVAATKLYFSQPSQTNELTTLQKTTGDTFSLDIIVNPGTNQNQVSFVKLNIYYDSQKLDVVGDKLKTNEAAFPATLEGPTYSSGNASVTVSVGADPAKVITSTTKLATITLKALAPTNATTTSIAFTGSQVLSIASSDQPSENVLVGSGTPLSLTIGGAAATPTPTPTRTPVQPTAAPTTPPAAGAPAAPTATPSATLTPTIAVATPTATPAAQVTVAPPGPSSSIVGIGIAGIVLSIIGGLLLLAL